MIFFPLFRGEHPNTYVFTKGLAEQLILDKGQNLPLAVVRPSIVVAAWKYPVKGWVDNLNGPTGCVRLIKIIKDRSEMNITFYQICIFFFHIRWLVLLQERFEQCILRKIVLPI